MKMINERGFFTLVGICFLLVAALLVKGVQESERNYSYVTKDFYNETDLQNIADSALIESINSIKNGQITLEKPKSSIRYKNQHPVPLKNSYDADVEVFYEYGIDYYSKKPNIIFKRKEYPSRKIVNTDRPNASGIILISAASRDTDDGKIYRKTLAYILENDEGELDYDTIYYMNHLNDD